VKFSPQYQNLPFPIGNDCHHDIAATCALKMPLNPKSVHLSIRHH